MLSGMTVHEVGYLSLCSAIVYQACIDYSSALRTLYGIRTPRTASEHQTKAYALSRARNIETFFESDWYKELTDVDPYKLMERIQRMARRGEAVTIKR
jgi:hypothetical protein